MQKQARERVDRSGRRDIDYTIESDENAFNGLTNGTNGSRKTVARKQDIIFFYIISTFF